jgi:hypothetical protein
MRSARSFFAAALAATMLLVAEGASSVSLRPGKATDDSVCDLTHDTNAFLSSKVLVPAAADQKDQVEALYRLAADFIATNCRDGQILLLQGSASVNVDAPSLTEVANSACSVASVERTEIRRSQGDKNKPGFQLRCMISKHEGLVKILADRERADSFAAIKARMNSKVGGEAPTSSSNTASTSKGECSKMTLSSVIAGGNCK